MRIPEAGVRRGFWTGLLLLGGCCLDPVLYPRADNPGNPFPVKKVAVCPLVNQTGDALDTLGGGEAAASELSGFPGFEVIWPRQWMHADTVQPEHLKELIQQGKAAGAEAVLLITVTESSVYSPPRLGLAMALYPTEHLASIPVPYEDLMESGKPMTSHLPRTEDPWLAAVGAVYNAQDNAVQDRLHAWGRLRDQSGASFDWKRGLYSREEFLRFSLNETLRLLCQRGHEHWGPSKNSSQKIIATPSP